MSRRLFRALLRLLPFDFRADYGAELEHTFDEQRRDAVGRVGRARVWAENIAALAAIGPREHLAQLAQDVKYAVRGMHARPGFVAAAIVTLALGTGANTAIFSIVHAVLLAPLPYSQPEDLLSVMNRWEGAPRAGLSDAEFLDYSEQAQLVDIAAMAPGTTIITGAGEPERVAAAIVTPNLFAVLGRQPALGRSFTASDARAGSDAAIISDALWRERFGARASVIGETLTVNGVSHTVVGVLAPDFLLPIDIAGATRSAVLVPTRFDPAAPRVNRGRHYLTGVGRLKPDVSTATAQAEMDNIVSRLTRQYPEAHNPPGFGVTLEPLREVLLGDSRPVLWTLAGAVGLVLLLACANVANLMMARGEARRRELSVRAVLGASRFRVVRQLVTEALVLSLIATAVGMLIAWWLHAFVVATGPATLPRLSQATLNLPVLGFAAALVLLTTLLFGVMPAIQLSARTASEALKDGMRGSTSGARAHVRRALVVCQVAAAVVLVIGAGLLLKSFVRVAGVPSGFDASNVLTARVSLPARYRDLADVSGFFTRLLENVRSLPAVESAGASTGLPLAVVSGDWGFDIEGRPREDGRRPGRADWYVVTPGYFETLRVSIIEGRGPLEDDGEGAAPVIFVNETTARMLFRHESAVGKRVKLANSTGPEQPWRTIAGVVSDVRQRDLDQPPRAEMFIPYRQFVHHSANTQARSMTLVVRTSISPEQLISAVRSELRRLDPLVPLADARSMQAVLSGSVADRRLSLMLVGGFAVLALVLAIVGVYGVVSFDMTQRTREIGVRIALGAPRHSVMSLMLQRGLRVVAVGVAVGLAVAVLVTRTVAELLYEVSPRDLGVFATVAGLLVLTGATATYLPARRAARVNPIVALRMD